jgi:hypothetical protein
MHMSKYNPWPLGQLPKEFQRPEPEQIREMGYQWDDPRDIIGLFEAKVAEFAGSNYAVATDSCSHALFLSLQYWKNYINDTDFRYICIPLHTYISVMQQIQLAGFNVDLMQYQWDGVYELMLTHKCHGLNFVSSINIWDAALRWTKDMYIPGSLMCLSFQIKKRIPIGRGGMILCDKKEEYEWLKLASYDGRDLNTPYDSPGHVKMDGWHYYMTPEDAARGIILMDNTPEVNEDQGGWENYPEIQLHR